MERIQIGDEVLITGVQDKLEAAVGRTGIVRWPHNQTRVSSFNFPSGSMSDCTTVELR